MAAKWFSGSGWCDVVALTSGWGLVRMDGLDVVCVIDNIEIWRLTASEPIEFLRAATDGTEVRAIGYGTTTRTARYFTSGTETSKGDAYGYAPVALTYESGDWTGYIVRSPLTYTRWPFAGVEPAADPTPFAAGTNMGIIQIVAAAPVWRESEATPGTNYSVTLNDVEFVFPMVDGTFTVGQSLGPPTNTDQIIVSHDTTETATVFAMAGHDPHLAELADGTIAVACRTQAVPLPVAQNPGQMSAYGACAFALLPPWTEYDPLASTDIPSTYAPYSQPVTDKHTGIVTKPWKDFFSQLSLGLSTPVDLDSIDVTGGASPSAPPVIPVGASADVLVGDNPSGFPDARLVTDTATIEWDIATPSEASANLTDTAVTPGTYGDAENVGQFTVDQQGRITAAVNVPIDAGASGWIEGLMRTLGDGSTVNFPLPDVAEKILIVSDAGAVVDPLIYTLSADGGSITFDTAPANTDVVTVNYETAAV